MEPHSTFQPNQLHATQPEVTIGFTGTSHGMTSAQLATVRDLLCRWHVQELHHGNCVGADAQAAVIAKELKIRTIAHPANDVAECFRRYTEADEIRPARPALKRNRDIAAAGQLTIATPKENVELRRSGTWSTVRYTAQAGRPCYIVFPDGSIQVRKPKSLAERRELMDKLFA